MTGATNAETVRTLVTDWAKAVERRDRAGILAHHNPNLLMFDFPDIVRGIDAYDRTWDFFYADSKGSITFAPHDLLIVAGDDVAFVTCTVHCDGTSAGPLDFRLTVGLRKQGGAWTIVHEHHSVPTIEARFLGSDEGEKQ